MTASGEVFLNLHDRYFTKKTSNVPAEYDFYKDNNNKISQIIFIIMVIKITPRSGFVYMGC